MDFADVASFFDDDPVYDGYTDVLLFYCHTTPHDDQTSSGATARRRTMTTLNENVPPARGVVKVYDSCWLVSDSNPDSFRGELVRRSYSLKKSTGLMAHLTPGQAALGSAGVDFYAQKEYFRDQADARTSGDWDVMWNVFCPLAEGVGKGAFLRQDGTIYRVRNAYQSIDRFTICETDQFDADAAQTAVFNQLGPVNLRTQEMTASAQSVPVLQTDVMKFYEFRTEGESAQKPGDRTVFMAQSSLTPPVGSVFTMMGMNWRILARVPEADSWALHVRLTS